MVRPLLLPTVTDQLLEYAVLVAQSVAHGRQLHRRHRVEKTGREPPEPAIAEARIRLLLEHAEPIDVLLPGEIRKDPVEHQAGDVVRQRPSDQELHRQVIDMLRVFARVGFLRQHPSLREDVAYRPGQRLESLAGPRGARRHDVVEDEVALVERIVGPREGDLAAAVLREQRGGVDRPGRNRSLDRFVERGRLQVGRLHGFPLSGNTLVQSENLSGRGAVARENLHGVSHAANAIMSVW